MKIISIVASKGGVGKTTISNVVAGILSELGKSVVLLDADCNQYSSETMSFSDLLPYPVEPVETKQKLDEVIKKGSYDFAVIDTAPHSHDSDLFIHILNNSDSIIGVTRPLPNDVLAFEKIMLPVLGQMSKPRKVLLLNQQSHIQSAIQSAAQDLIKERLSDQIDTLATALFTRAAYAAIGYFEIDEKSDKKKIIETKKLAEELQQKGIL